MADALPEGLLSTITPDMQLLARYVVRAFYTGMDEKQSDICAMIIEVIIHNVCVNFDDIRVILQIDEAPVRSTSPTWNPLTRLRRSVMPSHTLLTTR